MGSRVFKVALLALLAMGLSGAAAATLGGLTGGTLGADDQIVASCDDDGMTTEYSMVYNPASQQYEVNGVVFSGVDAACDTKRASVSLRSGTTNLGTTTVSSISVSGGSFSVPLSSQVSASAVDGLSLVVFG